MGIREAVALLAPPRLLAVEAEADEPGPSPWEECLEAAEAWLNGPFDDDDIADIESNRLALKFLHQAKMPTEVATCLRLAQEYGLPALRLCTTDDIMQALTIMTPMTKGKIPMAIRAQDPLEASITLMIRAQVIFVALWDEVADKKRSGKKHERECRKVIDDLNTAIEARRTQWEEIKAIPDEETRWARVNAIWPD